uniref:hybrid sensor histidine kinase/response regulator n=1 Tax=Thaumasiovibrio occultus TaxID=1891184 RepID=UPI000B35E5E3|nr:hybrid sensor histidine kinase/response regulator [Thaumasiovibrio occultus]
MKAITKLFVLSVLSVFSIAGGALASSSALPVTEVTIVQGYDKNTIHLLFGLASVLLGVITAISLTRKQKLSLAMTQLRHEHSNSSEQLTILKSILNRFPGMVVILDHQAEHFISNDEFKQCFKCCADNQCREKGVACDFLEGIKNTNTDIVSKRFCIEKDACVINGKYYQIYKENVANPDDDNGYTIVVFQDITTLKRKEGEIDAARIEALNALKARETFLAMISHELRTPLAAIMGLLELLSPEIKKPENKELFSSAQQSANRLNLLVNDILDFSKIEAKQMQLDITTGNIFTELSTQLRPFEALAINKNIDLSVKWQPTPYATADFDWLRLSQIVSNVLNNAIKFTSQGAVVVTIEQTADQLMIGVKDTGCGMTPEQLEHMFTPFSQGDRSISRKFGGTGLGMSIVKNLVAMMGGEIHVESQVNLGTAVKITIPCQFELLQLPLEGRYCADNPIAALWVQSWGLTLAEPENEGVVALSSHERNVYPDGLLKQIHRHIDSEDTVLVAPTALYSALILVADDDPINRLLFKKQLTKLGVNCQCVEDGVKAYEYLDQHYTEVDLVITDCHMPNLNGYDLTEKIRANPLLRNIPVIGCTAEDSRIAAERAISVGMDDMIYKPYTLEVLTAALAQYCQVGSPPPMQSQPTWLENFELDEQIELATVLKESLVDEQRLLEQDPHQLKVVAHRIKGSALILGVESLADIAKRCESASPEDHALAVARLLEEIDSVSKDIALWLEQV